jgi:hypothetical protein
LAFQLKKMTIEAPQAGGKAKIKGELKMKIK